MSVTSTGLYNEESWLSYPTGTSNIPQGRTTITFSFTKPSGEIGGYYLFQSSTGSDFVHVDTKVDSSKSQPEDISTFDVDGVTYYRYILPINEFDGKLLYFKIITISPSREESVYSNVVTAHTFPSMPSGISVIYDGFDVDISWDPVSTININDELLHYSVERNTPESVSGVVKVDSVLYSNRFIRGKSLIVVDTFKKSTWYGVITSTGAFIINNSNKILLASDSSQDYTPIIENLSIYIESGSYEEICTTTGTAFCDTTFNSGIQYFYSVKSISYGGVGSNRIYFPINTVDTSSAYPYLRQVENSSTGLLNNPYWKKLKNVLVDSNYYDKSTFAIPYSPSTTFNLKGYLGVSECNLDVFINGNYGFTTSTGKFGEFNINYTFPKGKTEIQLQARDKQNIKFSRKSAPYSIRTLTIYTWFSVLGNQYKQVKDELDLSIQDISIRSSRYKSFEERFAPLVELYKAGTEDEIKFRNIVTEVFKSFEYVSYDKSLIDILNIFKSNIDNFDHYELFFNYSLYQTHKTAYIPSSRAPLLERGNYYYGISAAKTTGEETPPTIIQIDRRWWPYNYKGYNFITWDVSVGAQEYKIYRGTSIDNLKLLTSVPGLMFVDDNYITPSSTGSLNYNFTTMLPPENVQIKNDVRAANFIVKLKKPSNLTIILFARGNENISELNINRLLLLFTKVIPPEIRYTVLYANDSKIIIYPDGIEIEPEPDPILAIYDHSNYDSGVVFA